MHMNSAEDDKEVKLPLGGNSKYFREYFSVVKRHRTRASLETFCELQKGGSSGLPAPTQHFEILN